MLNVELFIMVGPDKEACVGQPLGREEATKLAIKARKTRRNNKVKTCFVYGLTSLEGIQLFFKPLSVSDEQLKFISKTYTKGMVYVTYGN